MFNTKLKRQVRDLKFQIEQLQIVVKQLNCEHTEIRYIKSQRLFRKDGLEDHPYKVSKGYGTLKDLNYKYCIDCNKILEYFDSEDLANMESLSDCPYMDMYHYIEKRYKRIQSDKEKKKECSCSHGHKESSSHEEQSSRLSVCGKSKTFQKGQSERLSVCSKPPYNNYPYPQR